MLSSTPEMAEFRWLFWGAAGFAVLTIVFGLLVEGIDNAAHIGGFIAGALSGTLLLRTLHAELRLSAQARTVAALTAPGSAGASPASTASRCARMTLSGR